MSSNLFKAYYLNRNTQDARVINSNEMIAQKLESIGFALPQAARETGGFEPVSLGEGNRIPDPADMLSAALFDGDVSAEEAGNPSAVIKDADFAPGQGNEPSYQGPTREELLEQAKKEVQDEIELMRQNARQELELELEAERTRVQNSAQASGYEEGKRLAMQELEAAKQELEAERMRLQAVYEQQIDELEPMFVRTLTGIYEKVFEVELNNQQEIVVTLLRNTMKKLDGCKNFLVHVSSADYSYVREHKGELLSESTQEGTVIDIIEDGMMRENECTIETINGIYDCGIGTQLSELRKKLTLLSYSGQQES